MNKKELRNMKQSDHCDMELTVRSMNGVLNFLAIITQAERPLSDEPGFNMTVEKFQLQSIENGGYNVLVNFKLNAELEYPENELFDMEFYLINASWISKLKYNIYKR